MKLTNIAFALILARSASAGAAIPPPVYDFCGAAVAAVVDDEGRATYAGGTCDGENLVVDHLCSDFATHNGHEDYYAITLAAGESFTAMVTSSGDAALMVTAECIVYGTMFTCLQSADEEGTGGTEIVTWGDAGDGGNVYLVIDSHTTAGCGAYTLDLEVHRVVSADPVSLGAIKAAYR